MLLCYFGLYPLLDDGLMTSIFDGYLYDDDVVIFSRVHVVWMLIYYLVFL